MHLPWIAPRLQPQIQNLRRNWKEIFKKKLPTKMLVFCISFYENGALMNWAHWAHKGGNNISISHLQRPSDHQENDGHHVVFGAQVPFCTYWNQNNIAILFKGCHCLCTLPSPWIWWGGRFSVQCQHSKVYIFLIRWEKYWWLPPWLWSSSPPLSWVGAHFLLWSIW